MTLTVLIISERRKFPEAKIREQGKLYAFVKQGGQLGKNILAGRQFTNVDAAKMHVRNKLYPADVSNWEVEV